MMRLVLMMGIMKMVIVGKNHKMSEMMKIMKYLSKMSTSNNRIKSFKVRKS